MRIHHLSTFALLALACQASAAVSVRTDHLKPGDTAWKFNSIPGPSRSDIAQGALVTQVAGSLDAAAAPLDVLVNGKLPDQPKNLSQSAFFAGPATLVIDLGTLQPVAAVNTYSWHEFPDDQGARAPQVYTLSGSADQATWVKLAGVDTRSNTTGDAWAGKHGASVTDTSGKLGDFRFLKLEIQPTRSPKQPNTVWTNTLFAEIDVHTAATLSKAGDAAIAGPVKVTDIWVVTKTHFDLGFTDQAENVFDRYRVEMMEKSLAVMDENRALPANKRFTWTVPGWPLSEVILGPKQDPARKARIEQAIREGSLAVHALSSTTHTESLDPESLVRSLSYSSRIARDYGRPMPIAAKMTDVPSHSWIMPTLLEHAGIKFLHLGCNPASQYPRVPQLFWWQGADGSRVLCGYTHDYGSGLTPPANWPAKNYLALIMTGDNHGPPSTAEVGKMRDQLASSMPGVNVHFSTLDDFANAVLAENPDLPVIRGDMPDTWIHGLLSNPAATKVHRNTQPLEPALETLDTQLRLWNLNPSSLKAPLAKAYEQSLLYGEHTWGMNAEYGPRTLHGQAWKQWLAEMAKETVPADGDFTRVPRGSKRKWLQSYQDHRDYALHAERIVTRELKSRLAMLASNVMAKPGDTVVYNPLPWMRSGIVEVNGKRLFAKDVPAGGYLILKDQSDPSDPSDQTDLVDTPFFKATFDLKRGGVSSLVEKSTGRELADPSSPYALGQFLHERFSTKEVFDRFFSKYSRIQGGWGLNDIGKPGMPANVPYLTTTPDGWQIRIQRTATETHAVLTATDTKGLAGKYELAFTFPSHQASMDVEWRVTDKTADKHPEGGWLCFPFAVESPRFTVGRPGAPIDPAKDIIPGTNRHLLTVTSGVSITGTDAAGAAICPVDSPLVALDQPGLWWWTMDFVPRKPAAFVNLYNNMWNTNFPLWQDGSWSSRVRVWPVAKGSNVPQDLAVGSWETRVPLLAAKVETSSNQLPATRTGVAVSRPGVLVTAFGENPDGKGTILRVWDQSGVSGNLSIIIPGNFKSATPVNLRGEQAATPLPVTNGTLNIPLKAFAPASFILN